MKSLEQYFEQCKDWVKEIQEYTDALLELANYIATGDFELPMNLPGIAAHIDDFITRKSILLSAFKKMLQEQLVQSNSNEYTQNMLSGLWNQYTTLEQLCSAFHELNSRTTYCFMEHVGQEYKQHMSETEVIPADEQITNIGDILTIVSYLIASGMDFSKQISQAIRSESNIKQGDKSSPID
ncbi:hypothetical protein [Chitinophaga sp. Cy-1792]|uniref:hypothetical protein n=1 Tax=Chitinophaga sp. Cy-1792 TaxID=2608339 RepID=UPI001423C3AB|nr:hypothetical protein [Chitinophaga sp. Cy-1792]NIG53100.1 hypothetical protein [Chitinophaga sp. Cy-1792]